jgi:hypothetical protein
MSQLPDGAGSNLGAELEIWRERSKLSYRRLAELIPCEHSLLWKIKHGKASLTREMAEKCDRAMDTGGALVAALDAEQGRGRPAQLPPTLANLVGREPELAALAAGLADRPPGTPRVVAIDGPAGGGKTALALQWAHQVRNQFADGQLYVDLGGFAEPERRVTVDEVLEGFLTALGASRIPATTAGRAALYRSTLAGRRVLVVLDNASDATIVDHLLPASPSCGVVVTSRRALTTLVAQVGATRVTVGPLAETDSVALMCRLVDPGRADAELAALAALTGLCGRLPLALRATADQIAMYPHRSITDLVEEMQADDTAVLNALETIDLRQTFSRSYEQVCPDAAHLFRLIGLHRGPGIHAAAVAALAGMARSQAGRVLNKLALVHLVDIDAEDVVHLHPLVRAYAQDLADRTVRADERAIASRRLVSWYVGTTRAASLHLTRGQVKPIESLSVVDGVEALVFHDAQAAKAWCAREVENFGPVTTLALDYGPRDAAQQLAAGLHDMGLLDGGPTANAEDDDADGDAVEGWPTARRQAVQEDPSDASAGISFAEDDLHKDDTAISDNEDGSSWRFDHTSWGLVGPPWLRSTGASSDPEGFGGQLPEKSNCIRALRQAAVTFLGDPSTFDHDATARLWTDLGNHAGRSGSTSVPGPRAEPGSDEPSPDPEESE